MKLAKNFRIWEAASSPKEREALSFVEFDAKAGTLTATNSYIMARVPCEVEDGDESGLIPAAALKEAKGSSLKIADGFATLKVAGGERRWELGKVPLPPDLDKVLDRAPEVESPIGVNARLAADLAAALGADDRTPAMAIHPVHALRPMRVTNERGGMGILMPVRLRGSVAQLLAPDLSDDVLIVDAVRAAARMLEGKRGKARAAEAFRRVLRDGQSEVVS